MQKPVLQFFQQNLRHYKQLTFGILFLLPPTILFHQFLPPLILSGILNNLAAKNYVPGDLWGSFGIPLILFVTFRFMSATFLWRAILFLLNSLEGHITTRIHRIVFDHLVTQSARFHANHLGGSLVAATSRLTTAYSQLAHSIVMQFIPLLLSFLFTIIILLPRAPLYVGFLIIFSTVYLMTIVRRTQKVRRASNAYALAQNEQTGRLADSLANILAVKSSAAEKYERERFRKTTEQTKKKFFEMIRITQLQELNFNYFTASITSISIILAIASVVVFNTEIATTFLIIEYTGLLTGRLWEFTISTLRTYNRSIGEASDMVAILATPADIQNPVRPEKPHITHGNIAFNAVRYFHSDAKRPIFSDLSLSINAGERVGLVGHSGAGKTTFAKLLMRFDDVAAGSITIDGQDISHIKQEALRQKIAYVPQEPFLFHRTIKENIAYGTPNATMSEIKKAAKKAHAASFIEQLPLKYNTVVGERGVKLSGGQRQRIAIARAILKDAPILVLDEATSALDSESERKIQKAMEALMKQRTTIAIAHRLSTIQHLDRILVFQNGKVIEDGSHSELLAKNGVYARLWSHQSGGFIE